MNMEMSEASHLRDRDSSLEKRESHWLPALRPNSNDDIINEAISVQPTVMPQEAEKPSLPEKHLHPSDMPVVSPLIDYTDTKTSFDEESDGRLDPAWGFKRTDSTHLLDNAMRSSSFPPAPEQEQPMEIDQPLLNGTDFQEDAVDFSQMVNGEHILDDIAEPSAEPVENYTLHTIDQVNSLDCEQDAELVSDNRYEEGIPLISGLQQDPMEYSTGTIVPASAFDTGFIENEESSFFSQLPSQSTSTQSQGHLERKTTQDVLESLHLEKREKLVQQEENKGFQIEDDIFGGNGDAESSFFDKTLSDDAADGKDTNEDSKWAAALDDDEFLIEDADDLLPDSDSEPESPSSFIASVAEDASGSNQIPANVTSQTPRQTSHSSANQLSPKARGNVGFTRPGLGPMGSFQNHMQQTSITARAESFADQTKGGYKSPYDLPVDLKPKKRPQALRAPSQPQQGIPPPPRTSSMISNKNLGSPFTPASATFAQNSASAVISPAVTHRSATAPIPASGPSVQRSSSAGFFEELPVTSRPRPPSNSGRYAPAQSFGMPPPVLPPVSPPHQELPLQPPTDPYAHFQLRAPEKIDPYANVGLQPPSLPTPSASVNRYSPAPGAVPGVPRSTGPTRYSPAPPSQPSNATNRYASQPVAPPAGRNPPNRYATQPAPTPPIVGAPMPFMPRTSSPLAYSSRPPTRDGNIAMPLPSIPEPESKQQVDLQPQSSPRKGTMLPPTRTAQLPHSPPKQANAEMPGFTAPQRSQTQSPSRMAPRPALAAPADNSNRPQTAYDTKPVLTRSQPHTESQPAYPTGLSRAPQPEMEFEQPQDETAQDPLQRWKGAPVFKFGFGGVLLTSFPKHTPRYKAGQIKPQIKSTAGMVKTRLLKELSILPEHVVSFPGPLKGKGKKKELLSWMTSTITRLESSAPVMLGAAQTVSDPRKCHEELVLLWKIVKIIIENDGVWENKPEALKAFNMILSPEVHAIDESTASQYRADTELSGIYRPGGTVVRSDSADPLAVEALRKHLLKGEREEAVWKAADNRLWSHALLIASTIRDNQKTWKQVVQEFVRQEVKTIGNNAESLSALYEVFGGNMEESIDQLVPPSARAGLQMVSVVDTAGPTRNALDGLDKWKETLTLVLNNRTPEDQRALATLGGLLASYGRVEAAHICFLFARNPLSPNVFGGIDDQQASITLIGSNRQANPYSFHQDHDAILLTEAYEFAISTLAPAPMSMPLPHLSAYKLQRALDLADNGLKTEAQAYCDAVASGITAKNKMSPYYNQTLLMEVDELAKRLKQVPVQGASWIAKPSVERATSSLLNNLINFVAGEDSDAESKGSAADVGPFAKTSGSPSISRSGSQTDLYGSYPSMTPAVPMTAAASKYAPGGLISARSSTDLTRGRISLDSQRSPPTTSHGNETRPSRYNPSLAKSQPSQSPARSVNSFQAYGTSPRNSYEAVATKSSYVPQMSSNMLSNGVQEERRGSYQPMAPPEEQSDYSFAQYEQNFVQQDHEQPIFGGYLPSAQPIPEVKAPESDEPPISSHEPSQSYGYEPPADGGYVPYQPEPDSDDDDSKKSKPKKKSFMDDDDEDYSRMSTKEVQATKSSQNDLSAAAKRKANDEAADAAFQAAAEADAQRAADRKKAASGGGWLGGWFGGKKGDGTSLDAPKSSGTGSDTKVFKAKLGEDKMKLYYDKDLKKWVNPDDPDAGKAKSTPPPPPSSRSPLPPTSAGGPPRVGGTPAPPMGGISRSSTPASVPGSDVAGLGLAPPLPPSIGAGLPSGLMTPMPAGLAPPSRPASNASSIDDLIGPAAGRTKPRGAKGAKKGRYVDVMAQ